MRRHAKVSIGPSRTAILTSGLLILLIVAASPTLAQEEKKKDDTGTNPINFTYDARFYSEMSWLRDNGSNITNTFEFRAPVGRDLANLTNQKQGIFNDLGSRLAYRIKTRYQSLTLDDAQGSPTTITGIGDIDFRLLGIPHVTNKFGIATGLEFYFPTASSDALGSGRFAAVPQIFFGFFGLFALQPQMHRKDFKPLAAVLRAFPVAFVPIVPFGIWAVWQRIAQYGWTEFRYARMAALVCLGIFSLIGAYKWLRKQEFSVR